MELDSKLAEAKEREEEYPDQMYMALYREGMLDSQIIEREILERELRRK